MRRIACWLVVGVSLLSVAAGGQSAAKIPLLRGQVHKYKVKQGDTLLKIARHTNVNIVTLARINSLANRRLRPGMTLLLPTLHITPRDPAEGIVLNVPAQRVYVFTGGRMVGDYPVAVGKPDWQTALGTYRLVSKEVDPKWTPTSQMVAKEKIKDDPVPPGKDNPLGDRWMGWSAAGYGFHSTNIPRSVGRVITHGCVRLYPEAAHKMLTQVKVGMTIYSVYEPILVGERDGQFYLAVFPDVYHKGLVSQTQAQKRLKKDGLLPLADPKKIRAIERLQDGYPHRIVGTDMRLEVNGSEVKLPISPMLIARHWLVPVKPVVAALGGDITPAEKEEIKITHGDHSLLLTAGQKSAKLDGQKVTLPGEPTIIEENWVAPLGALTLLFDLSVDDSAKHILSLQSQTAATPSNTPAPPTVPSR